MSIIFVKGLQQPVCEMRHVLSPAHLSIYSSLLSRAEPLGSATSEDIPTSAHTWHFGVENITAIASWKLPTGEQKIAVWIK